MTITEPTSYEASPPPTHRRNRSRRRWWGLVLALVVVVALVVGDYEREVHASGPPGRAFIFVVHDGESEDAIASALVAHHVIDSSWAYSLYRLVHSPPPVQPGEYYLHANMTFGAVGTLLAGGPNVYAFDVRPGLTLSEVVSQLGAVPGFNTDQFARLVKAGTVVSPYGNGSSGDLEGLIGTGDYQIVPGESAQTLLGEMVDRFNTEAASVHLSTAAAALGYSPYQLVITASIVEKEGYYPKNMGPVARVIYNRLANGMALQMNATVLYALGQDGGTVTQHDLELPTPYNTYLHTGLTPTPICTPSLTALRAAADPPAGAWLYFVLVSADGTEAFADTYAEQLANEQLAKERGVG